MTRYVFTNRPLEGRVALINAGVAEWADAAAAAIEQAGAKVAVATHPDLDLRADWTGLRGEAYALRFEGILPTTEATEAAVQEVVRRLGRLDLLVNVPQVEPHALIAGTDNRMVSATSGRNVSTAYAWTRAAGMHMALAGGGSIVTFISAQARRGVAASAAFSMTQAALDAMTRSLAVEWAAKGVRVNGIGYGWVELARRPIEEQQRERLVRFLPLRRKGHPDDYMGLLVYMASDASAFVTGQTVFVDGGAMAHA